MNMNRKVLKYSLLIISFIVFLNLYVFDSNIIINEINSIKYSDKNDLDRYEVQQVKLLGVTLRVKGEYDDKIKTTPLTCKVDVERMTRLIYMDGNEELGDKYITYQKPAGKLMRPLKKGYEFVQWTNKEGELIDELSIINSTIDYKIYANWNIVVSELNIDPNGGTWKESPGVQSFNLEFDQKLKIDDPTRVGYTFLEWELTGEDSNLEDKMFTMGPVDATLKALYKPNKYNLTINPNGGVYNNSTNATEMEILYDSTTTISMPTRIGYTFVGWTVSSGELNDDKFFMNSTEDVTLTANWLINDYTYVVYHNQQSVDGSSYNKVASDTESGNKNYNTVISPNVKSYIGFTAPPKQSLTIDVDTQPPQKNIINYYYTRNKYNLTINPNGGVWNNKTTSFTTSLYYEQTYTVANPTKTGYNFAGWTNSSSDSSLVDKVFKMGLSNTTLTAKWTAKTYTLSYNVNGGNALSSTSKVITYDQAYGTLPTPTRTGYTFSGWYTSRTGGTKVTSSTVHQTDGNVTLYAHWSNTAPTKPTLSVRYNNSDTTENGVLKNGSETVTITVRSTDKEDGTPTFSLACKSGHICSNLSITKTSQSSGQAVFTVRAYQVGTGLLEVIATDKGGLTSTSNEVIYIYSEDEDRLYEGAFTDTTFDSGWLDLLDGCYISDFTFTVQFASGHNNGNNDDHLKVFGKTDSGKEIVLYSWTGNMMSSPHSSTVDLLNSQNAKNDKIRQVRFETYSPHSGCTPSATISYSVKYKFDINLLD